MSDPDVSAEPTTRPNLEEEPADTLRILSQELRFSRTMGGRIHATIALLGVLSFLFILVAGASDILTSRFRPLGVPYAYVVVLGAKNNEAIRNGELWRLGTSMLLHGNLLHLAVNAYALWVLGTVLERLYGMRRFLSLFVIAGLGGAVASYLFTDANSVGASGAIFGLLGAAVIFGVKFRGILPARVRRLLTMGLLPWVALNLFIGTVFPEIDNAAHIGGMVTGGVVAIFLGARLQGPPSRGARIVQWTVLTASLLFMGYCVVAGMADGLGCTATVDSLEQCLGVPLPLAGASPG